MPSPDPVATADCANENIKCISHHLIMQRCTTRLTDLTERIGKLKVWVWLSLQHLGICVEPTCVMVMNELFSLVFSV